MEFINLDIATITALVGLIFSIIWNTISLRKSNTIAKDSLMHDMVKEEISNWKSITDKRDQYKGKKIPPYVKSHIFNYYEYLAYLILIGKIDEKHAKKIWKPNIYGMFEEFNEEFLGNRVELEKLYQKWKKEDEKGKSK